MSNTTPRFFESSASYKVDKTTFVVERVFRKDSGESINSILVKLIKNDANNT